MSAMKQSNGFRVGDAVQIVYETLPPKNGAIEEITGPKDFRWAMVRVVFYAGDKAIDEARYAVPLSDLRLMRRSA